MRCNRRVLILTQQIALGGLEKMILNLSRGLKQAGEWEPHVFVYDDVLDEPGLHQDFEVAGIPLIAQTKPRGFSFRAVRDIVRYAREHSIRVIHSHDMGALIYAVAAKILSFGRLKIVHTQHSFIHLAKAKRYRYYERIFTFFVDEVNTVSQALWEQYRTLGMDPSRIKVVSNGVEFPEGPTIQSEEKSLLRLKLLDRDAEKIWVLCMARIHPKKGQDQVLEIWKHLDPELRSRALLIFVGSETFPGALTELQKRIADQPDPESVVYAGFTLRPLDWMRASDLFVSGSEFEGMPLGPIEALGAGLDTVVSDIPGHESLGERATRFPLSQPETGARVLEDRIRNFENSVHEERQRAWTRGGEIRGLYGVSLMAKNYSELYGGV